MHRCVGRALEVEITTAALESCQASLLLCTSFACHILTASHVVQIMVDDAAAIVIMLSPEPKQKVQNLQAPAAACVASVSNGVANSAEAKAARDKLAALPYQNFFRHLQLVIALTDLDCIHFHHALCCQSASRLPMYRLPTSTVPALSWTCPYCMLSR